MRRPLYFIAAIIAISSVALLFASPGRAADLNVNKRHISGSDCGPSVAKSIAEFTARTACLAIRYTAHTARMVEQPIGVHTPTAIAIQLSLNSFEIAQALRYPCALPDKIIKTYRDELANFLAD